MSGEPVPGNLLAGRRALILGVANDHSIAWGIARAFAAQGAELAFTYQGEALGQRDHPPLEAVALIGEGELGAVRGEGARDAPGDRMVVGDAEDQRPSACEESGLPHHLTHDTG